MKTKEEFRSFLDSLGYASKDEQNLNEITDWQLIISQYLGTKINIPIVKRKNMEKIEMTVNIGVDEKVSAVFDNKAILNEWDTIKNYPNPTNIVLIRNPKLTKEKPQKILSIQVYRNLYGDVSEQTLIDGMDYMIKSVSSVFSFLRKNAKVKNVKTDSGVTQGTG